MIECVAATGQICPIRVYSLLRRLAEASIEPSVGSVGDSHDNARQNDQRSLQHRRHPSAKTMAQLRAVEFTTLEWVDWFNGRLLLEHWEYPAGRVRQKDDTTPCWTCQPWQHNLYQKVSGKPRAVHSTWLEPISRALSRDSKAQRMKPNLPEIPFILLHNLAHSSGSRMTR